MPKCVIEWEEDEVGPVVMDCSTAVRWLGMYRTGLVWIVERVKSSSRLEKDGKACKEAKEDKAKTVSMLEAKSSRAGRSLTSITA